MNTISFCNTTSFNRTRTLFMGKWERFFWNTSSRIQPLNNWGQLRKEQDWKPPNPTPILSRSTPHQTSRWANYDEAIKRRVHYVQSLLPRIHCAPTTKNTLFTRIFRISSSGVSSKAPVIYRLTVVSYPQKIISRKEVSVFLMLNCISQTWRFSFLFICLPWAWTRQYLC